ncbi:GntR family transcriptional regulator [Paenibacillus cremeus]|uniref:GntR family transcriptional regulator n=1 Tax=Paenibacillus cremeus TaxID=2163881 RepID=UPI0021BD1A78|nr:GntR family transcriptional regulator [Paenibacillus cremeus]
MPIKAPFIVTGRRTLGEHVYEQLRDLIITLQLEPGQMVYENELSGTLGVSRTPIREAFRLLASERLIEVLPQRGTRIAPISEKTVKDSRFVRVSLEVSGFRSVAEQWTDTSHFRSAKLRIKEWIGVQKEAQSKGNLELFLQADEAYHRSILELTGNSMLLNVVYHMRGHLNRLRYLALQEVSQVSGLIAEHEQLLELLEQKEVEAVEQLLEIHLSRIQSEMSDIRARYPHYFTD